eukprot:6267958-Prymnesium_polylepis.1
MTAKRLRSSSSPVRSTSGTPKASGAARCGLFTAATYNGLSRTMDWARAEVLSRRISPCRTRLRLHPSCMRRSSRSGVIIRFVCLFWMVIIPDAQDGAAPHQDRPARIPWSGR